MSHVRRGSICTLLGTRAWKNNIPNRGKRKKEKKRKETRS
jgi:hypothetical protein